MTDPVLFVIDDDLRELATFERAAQALRRGPMGGVSRVVIWALISEASLK
jgi:hypothetical protein